MPCEDGIKETSTAGELHQSDKMSLDKAWKQKAHKLTYPYCSKGKAWPGLEQLFPLASCQSVIQ